MITIMLSAVHVAGCGCRRWRTCGDNVLCSASNRRKHVAYSVVWSHDVIKPELHYFAFILTSTISPCVTLAGDISIDMPATSPTFPVFSSFYHPLKTGLLQTWHRIFSKTSRHVTNVWNSEIAPWHGPRHFSVKRRRPT